MGFDIKEYRRKRKEKNDAVSMTKDRVSFMYNSIELETLEEILSDVEWHAESDERGLPPSAMFIEGVYGKTALAGITDYTDHRNDSLEALKEKTLEQIKTRTMQNGHYYDKDGNVFDGVLLKGSDSGWTAYTVFSKNKMSYFNFMRSFEDKRK